MLLTQSKPVHLMQLLFHSIILFIYFLSFSAVESGIQNIVLDKAVSDVFLFCFSLFVDNNVRGSLDTVDVAG